MSDIEYKLLLIDEMAAVMKQKLVEKEPRPAWRTHPRISLKDLEKWMREEISELLTAEPGQEMREAADVANLAMIWADVRRRGGP